MNLKSRKIVYFGLSGVFSSIPYRKLIEADATIEAVIFQRHAIDQRGMFLLPSFDVPKIDLPMVTMPVTDNLQVEASRFGTDIFSIGDLTTPSVIQGLKSLEADIFIIACFPHIFPPEILAIPKDGAINLHPSLLPAYRGPEPLFWQFYHQEPDKGVSLHFMDAGFDTGPLIAQQSVDYPADLAGYPALEKIAAEASAELLLQALAQETIPQTPQSNLPASYYPYPKPTDFQTPAHWDTEQTERMNTLFGHFGQFE